MEDMESGLLSDWEGEPLVVCFFIALPHPMMLDEGTTVFMNRPDERVEWVEFNGGVNFVVVRIWRRETVRLFDYKYQNAAFDLVKELTENSVVKSDNIEIGADTDENVEYGDVPWPEATYKGCVVEVATPLLPHADGTSRSALSSAFDRCIADLYRFSLTYMSITDDKRFRPITRHTCPMLVPLCFQTKESGEYFGFGAIQVHLGDAMPFEPEELTDEQKRKFEISWDRRRSGDPFAGYIDWSRIAHRLHLIEGEYAQAVIAAYTSVEILLNTVMMMCAWEAGESRTRVAEWFASSPRFVGRARRYLEPMVGGNWNEKSPGSVMFHLLDISHVRNEIAHRGSIPGEYTVGRVLDGRDKIEEFIKDRLADRRLDYPRTCLLLLGTPGLERRGLWSGKIRRWSETYGDQEPSYTTWFQDWDVNEFWEDRCPVPPIKLKERRL